MPRQRPVRHLYIVYSAGRVRAVALRTDSVWHQGTAAQMRICRHKAEGTGKDTMAVYFSWCISSTCRPDIPSFNFTGVDAPGLAYSQRSAL
jgi:hypothetical protein